MPVLLNNGNKPYTQADAARYLEMLASKAFANPAHTPKQSSAFGQKAVPEGGHQKRLAQVLRQKLELSNSIKRSYDEHERAGGTRDALFELGRYVAFRTNATFVPGPLKGWDGVVRKVIDFQTAYDKDDPTRVKDRGYEGNYASVKDEVRMTLVCDDEAMYTLVCKKVVETVAGGGMELMKNVETKAELDACGYSGTNMVVRLSNGEPGEIQINTPNVMYGKMTAGGFKAQLGMRDDEYELLKKSYHNMSGGYGHALYEIYRTGKDTPRGETAARLSKRYYDLLRRRPRPPASECREFSAEINTYRDGDSVVNALFMHAGLFPEIGVEQLARTRTRR